MKKGSRTVGFAFIQQITFQGFQFLSFLILVRVMSPEAVGVWTLYLTFHAFFETARTGFIHNGFVKFCMGEPGEQGKIFSAALVWKFLWATVLVAVFGGIAWAFAEQFQAPVLWDLAKNYLWVAYPAALFQLFKSYQVTQQDFQKIWFGVIGLSTSLFSGVVLLWLWGKQDDLIFLQRFQMLGYTLGTVVLWILSRKTLKWHLPTTLWMGKLFHFGKYSMGTGIGSMLFTKVDVFMIGYLIGPAAVAIYSVATRINSYMDLPLNAFSQAFYPKISARIQESKKHFPMGTVQEAIAIMLLVAIPTALIFVILPKLIILLLAGETYLPAVPLLQIFACMVLVKPFGRVFGITLDAIGKPHWNFNILMASLVLNTVTNFFLIQWMGFQGAAWATMLATWLSILMGQYLISRYFQLSYLDLLKGVGRAIVKNLNQLVDRVVVKSTAKEIPTK